MNAKFSGVSEPACFKRLQSLFPISLKTFAGKTLASIVIITFLLLVMVVDADAGISDVKLSDACNMLNIIGMPTRGWETPFNDECGCSSRGKRVGTGNPFQNEISYFVEGNRQNVTQIRLIVSILNLDDRATAMAEFQFAVKYLVMKLTGSMLPERIKYAIAQGTDAHVRLKGFSIMVKQKEWVLNSDSGRVAGCDLRIIIR